jgi:DNA-directed RNA polymerase subunit N (RpoN/RPB10)
MIIPVRCVTCGKMIADKWRYYQRKTASTVVGDGGRADDDESPEAAARRRKAMDELGMIRYCCRRMFLGQVDLIEKI